MLTTSKTSRLIALGALLALLVLPARSRAQSVGLGTETPNASAILDITSTDKGILVPRMTTAQRTAIASPANGLLVFDVTTGSFWFYNNMAWSNLAGGGTSDKIVDADNDTKVQVEKNPDEDIIRFDLGGFEKLALRANASNKVRIEPIGNDENILIGINAGAALQAGGTNNIAVGSGALLTTTTGDENIGLGPETLASNTTGNRNIAIGTNALAFNTTGGDNTAVGPSALYNNIANYRSTAIGKWAMYNADNRTTGRETFNTAIGFSAMAGSITPAINTGQHNTAIGDVAMEDITSGNYNVALGSRALRKNTSGSDNTAIGHAALGSNRANSRSTAIGEEAMYAADDRTAGRATYNTAVGYQALFGGSTAANNTGQYNTAVGDAALRYNTSGNNNTTIGSDCMFNNSTGSNNTAMGQRSMLLNTTGSSNTAIGFDALNDNTIGISNTALGSGALNTNVSGDHNTAIGVSAYWLNSDLNNTTCIGYNSGNQSQASNRIEIGNTSVTWIGGEVNWGTYSDARIKRNVQENVAGLDFITRLRPVTYNLDIHAQNALTSRGKPDTTEWPEKYDIEQKTMTGFIAQEVEAAAQAVGYDFSGVEKGADEVGLYSVRYAEFVVPLVKAVQEQQALITEQQTRLETQQAAITEMEERLAKFDALEAALGRLEQQLAALQQDVRPAGSN